MDSKKTVLWALVAIFGAAFAYVPVWLWRADPFGIESIIAGMVGSLFGIWLWYKIGR